MSFLSKKKLQEPQRKTNTNETEEYDCRNRNVLSSRRSRDSVS